MTTNEKVSKESYHRWRKDPVTLAFFKAVEKLTEQVNEQFALEDLIMSDRLERESARLLGNRDALQMILDIKSSDLIEEDDDDEMASGGA